MRWLDRKQKSVLNTAISYELINYSTDKHPGIIALILESKFCFNRFEVMSIANKINFLLDVLLYCLTLYRAQNKS